MILILLNQTNVIAQDDGPVEKAANSSTKSDQSKDLIRTANDLKSGNWMDILTSFFQVAATDIAGKDHAISFKSTLFALKVKADSSLLIDKNYIKQKFARNFQFNFSLKLDTSYRFNGFNGGFTWAILNKRDNSVIQFMDQHAVEFDLALDNSLNGFYLSLLDADKKSMTKENLDLYTKTGKVIREMLNDTIFSISRLPKEFQKFASKKLDSLFALQEKAFNQHLAEVAKQPLVTLSGNASFDKDKKLDGGDLGFVWLQDWSIKKLFASDGLRAESDIRGSATLKDTTITNTDVKRSIFDVSGGFNFIWMKNNRSIVEFKPYVEYKNILHGQIPNESKDDFYFNGDLRIRINDDFWIPLTIKYDVNKKNLFGFINVSINMNAFKSPKS